MQVKQKSASFIRALRVLADLLEDAAAIYAEKSPPPLRYEEFIARAKSELPEVCFILSLYLSGGVWVFTDTEYEFITQAELPF